MKDILEEAITTGEVLHVIYDGGSDPGSTRNISPISISGEKVTARCLNSGRVKTFLIQKLRLTEDPQSGGDWSPPPPPTEFPSLNEFFDLYESNFKESGWFAKNEEVCVSLHRVFKNGKPMKGADVSLDFVEVDFDLIAGPFGNIKQVNHRIRVKPWVVRGKKTNESRSFKRLANAATYFNSLANQYAPSTSL
ncbi:MAG: hypothetical protein QF498_03175 [Arenicellales bacterium]|jgi:hypothetical protein|nr:hypothetical protein [Arenicellales bacterium]|tara:strand:- start:464 stop:1042 length:579 start_codon:yes stop_codon:yes gene_type:complete